MAVTGAAPRLAGRVAGGDGTAGLSTASTAGNAAAAVPAVVVAANPAYAPPAPAATALVASCVVVTATPVPLATAWRARLVGADLTAGGADPAPAAAPGAAAELDRGVRAP